MCPSRNDGAQAALDYATDAFDQLGRSFDEPDPRGIMKCSLQDRFSEMTRYGALSANFRIRRAHRAGAVLIARQPLSVAVGL